MESAGETWAFVSEEHRRQWEAGAHWRPFAVAVVAALGQGGLPPAEAAARLQRSPWWGILGAAGDAVLRGYPPAAVAAELREQPRCAICGHGLRRTAEGMRLPVLGTPRHIRGLPHFAPCSCGYAERWVEPLWVPALLAHFQAHPEALELDANTPGFLARLVPPPGPEAPGQG